MRNPNMPELFVGRSQQDEGEPDTFDGTIWAAPTAQDWRDQAGGGPDPDVTVIAVGIRYEEDAARLVLAWNCHDELLAACEFLMDEFRAFEANPNSLDPVRLLSIIHTIVRPAVAKAKGETP